MKDQEVFLSVVLPTEHSGRSIVVEDVSLPPVDGNELAAELDTQLLSHRPDLLDRHKVFLVEAICPQSVAVCGILVSCFKAPCVFTTSLGC